MTTPITSASALNNIPAAVAPTGLTAEGILAYCTSRLNTLDSLIQNRFAEQRTKNDAVRAAGALMAQLNTMNSLGDGKGMDATAETNHKLMGVALATQFDQTSDPQVRQKICEAYKLATGNDLCVVGGKAEAQQLNVRTITLNKSEIHPKDANQWQGFIGDVKGVQDSLTKTGELAMIELQSVVSQRQLAIQLSTQLIAAVNEGKKTVVSNIRV